MYVVQTNCLKAELNGLFVITSWCMPIALAAIKISVNAVSVMCTKGNIGRNGSGVWGRYAALYSSMHKSINGTVCCRFRPSWNGLFASYANLFNIIWFKAWFIYNWISCFWFICFAQWVYKSAAENSCLLCRITLSSSPQQGSLCPFTGVFNCSILAGFLKRPDPPAIIWTFPGMNLKMEHWTFIQTKHIFPFAIFQT